MFYQGKAVGVDFEKANLSFLQKKDRILLAGDSITGGSTKQGYINTSWYVQWNYYLLTRFPKLKIKTVNLSIPGIRVSGVAMYQLKNTYPKQKYNKAIVYMGTNDCMAIYNLPTLLSNYQKVLNFFQNRNVSVLACISPAGYAEKNTPTLPVTVTTHNTGFMKEFSFALQKELSCPFVYQLDAFQDTLMNLYREKGISLFQDGIHPNAMGSAITFAHVIDTLRLPGEVTRIEIANGKEKAVNCEISKLKIAEDISFDYLAKALPFSSKATFVQEANEIMDYMEKFSREVLQVRGLTGKYSLQIDGQTVATVTAEELGKGINLALYETPMTRQAETVADEMQKMTDAIRHQCDYDRYYYLAEEEFGDADPVSRMRTSEKPEYKTWLSKGGHSGMKKRYREIEKMWDGLYRLARPKKHHIEIKKEKA